MYLSGWSNRFRLRKQHYWSLHVDPLTTAFFVCRYQVGGIVQTLVTTLLIDAFQPALSYLLEPQQMFLYYGLSRYARAQVFLNQCLEPIEYDLPFRYASLVKTMGLAILYAPLIPIAPFIALAGVNISYYVDRYVGLRVSKKPKVCLTPVIVL